MKCSWNYIRTTREVMYFHFFSYSLNIITRLFWLFSLLLLFKQLTYQLHEEKCTFTSFIIQASQHNWEMYFRFFSKYDFPNILLFFILLLTVEIVITIMYCSEFVSKTCRHNGRTNYTDRKQRIFLVKLTEIRLHILFSD